MDEEIQWVEKNQTWELVDVPKYKDVINIKCIYKIKKYADGNVQNHKERRVTRGFTQQPDIYFNETFALDARMDTMRTVLAIVAQNKWPVYQMDVKSTFLKDIWMKKYMWNNHKAMKFQVKSTKCTG